MVIGKSDGVFSQIREGPQVSADAGEAQRTSSRSCGKVPCVSATPNAWRGTTDLSTQRQPKVSVFS